MCSYNGDLDNVKKFIRRGDIVLCDLGVGEGSEQNGIRPCVVIQNDLGNKYSPTIIIATITSSTTKAKLPTHIEVDEKCGLDKKSVILCEQLRTIDKSRVIKYIGSVTRFIREKINDALITSLEIFKAGELKVRDKVTMLKTKESMILELINEGVAEKFIYRIVEQYKEELAELKDICEKNRLYFDNYYKANYDMEKLLGIDFNYKPMM